MHRNLFSNADLREIRGRGMSEQQVLAQIELFRGPAPYMRLRRPCTLDDGIRTLSEKDLGALTDYHRGAANQGRCVKFVPASGAATRMFKVPVWFYNLESPLEPDELARKTESGDKDCGLLLTLLKDIARFAFFDDLKAAMGRDGLDPQALAQRGKYHEILAYLLTSSGLDYGSLPKGLLKFHRYPDGCRTSFEEHLVEAAEYVRDANGLCRLHFTVSPEHLERFERLWKEVRPIYEDRHGVRYDVRFSVQKPSTDTIAVDLENRPFRLPGGDLLFRPGGHGALIENLSEFQGDIVFIKNIDNVVPDRLKALTFQWKKALAGYLILTQQRIFSYLEKLAKEIDDEGLLHEILMFAKDELSVHPPEDVTIESPQKMRTFLFRKLNRPLRVCGMVKNEGEPGGGPFWVEDRDGNLSIQIVESAQVDRGLAQQEEIWVSSTHFNPVDIVCGVRDYQGDPFDLRQYVDPRAVFISRKSKDGRELKALELPGLWNGAMAHWNTIFIEVPLLTFNPVKTIFDLLREEHQPSR